jgi:hypothetical protein
MSWRTDEEVTSKALKTYWNSKDNAPVLSPRGQRKNSDKLLIDGEIFFAVFLGAQGQATIRTVDPLEITEIITNPDDIEDVKLYKREWSTPQGQQKVGYYRSFRNEKDEATPDSTGTSRQSTEDAFIYHLTYNTTGQRGLPLLLPALDWIKLYRQFLASRVAVMLALARFAWKAKVQGGAAAVASAKAVYNEQTPAAGSVAIENMGADLQPIKTDSGASQAYQDGRMIKLQVAAATGWPEQYFGDVSTGNLATAKTVELPVKKMCESYQAVWAGAYDDIDQFVLEHNGVPEDKRYIDRDFPSISPEDAGEIAASIAAIMPYFPQFAESPDVIQQALMAVGVHDTNDALEALDKVAKENDGVSPKESTIGNLVKALREYKVSLAEGGEGSGNFGHAGRPDEVGGSGPGGVGVSGGNADTRARAEQIYNKTRPTEQVIKAYGQPRPGTIQAASVDEIELHIVNAQSVGLDPEKVKWGTNLTDMQAEAHSKRMAYNKRAGIRSLSNKYGEDFARKVIAEKSGRSIRSPGYGSAQAAKIAAATGEKIH